MRLNLGVLWSGALPAACLVAGLTTCAERIALEGSAGQETGAEAESSGAQPVACLVVGLTACTGRDALEVSAGPETGTEAAPSEASSATVDEEGNAQIALIPVQRPLPPPLDPESLIGSNEAEVIQTLGTPSDTRMEAPATIWSYGDDSCSLDLYYFLDVSGNSLRVLNYQVRTAEDTEAMRRKCLRRLNRRT